MLLSIDRVLLLLSEGKNVEKIAELAETDINEVVSLIHEARTIVMRARPELARKKVRLKTKKISNSTDEKRSIEDELLLHAEFSVVPVEQPFVIYIAVIAENEGHRYSLLLLDDEGKQFGKLVEFSVLKSDDAAWLQAVSHGIRIAQHFAATSVTIRHDKDRLGDILSGRALLNGKTAQMHEELSQLVKNTNARVELVDHSVNEKAYHLLTLK